MPLAERMDFLCEPDVSYARHFDVKRKGKRERDGDEGNLPSGMGLGWERAYDYRGLVSQD